MKKVLSFVLASGFAFTAIAQTLFTDNFNSYTVGNLGTQGGWDREGGSASMAKVANIDAAHGKSFQFASTAQNQGMWIFHAINWDGRTPGNDVIKVDLEIYTGANGSETQLYNVEPGDDEPIYFTIADIVLSPEDGAYFLTQEDLENEGPGTDITNNISANTWYKVSMVYDFYEGTVMVTIDGTEYGPFVTEPGYAPLELDFVATSTDNSGYDNIVATAINSAMGTTSATKTKANIYPNPATDIVNVVSDKKISSISIFDNSGRNVKSVKGSTTANVKDLAKGNYILNITYVDGTTESKKIIKE